MAPPTWLLLLASLPTSSATPRMRLWRAINALGCISLRDGAYLLPNIGTHAVDFGKMAAQTIKDNGQAWVLFVAPPTPNDEVAFEKLFDRSAGYSVLINQLQEARKKLNLQTPAQVTKLHKRLFMDFDAIQRVDFFPNQSSTRARAAWSDFHEVVNKVLSTDEPHPSQRQITSLDIHQYQGRRWATRRHLWVDRVASAWLIQRFIDLNATFVWLDTPDQCPSDALGFDFDSATFSHIGDRVTFEVLMSSFALDNDPALTKLASLVHCLDVGGPSSQEAAGFEAILSGARTRLLDDSALLDNISAVLDSLYAYYQTGERT